MMRSSNPTLNDKVFQGLGQVADDQAMTLQGTVNKTGFLLFLVVATAMWVWGEVSDAALTGMSGNIRTYMMVGSLGGFVVAIVTVFKKTWAPVTAPMYSVLKGLLLGSVSAMYETQFPGIVMNAVMLTFGTFFALLFAYTSGMIKATENFKLGLFAATGGVMLLYLANFIMSFFGMSIPFIHESGMLGIGFSLVVVVIAALNLVMDFDFIENGCERGAPKYMEWYAGFGLIVTLVWLYLEMLRLLAKLQRR